jgi:hypothetical protein
MNIFKRLFGRNKKTVQMQSKPALEPWVRKPIEEVAEELRREVSRSNRGIFGENVLVVEISPTQPYLPDATPDQQCLVLVNFRELGGVMRPLTFGGYIIFIPEEKGVLAAKANR